MSKVHIRGHVHARVNKAYFWGATRQCFQPS